MIFSFFRNASILLGIPPGKTLLLGMASILLGIPFFFVRNASMAMWHYAKTPWSIEEC